MPKVTVVIPLYNTERFIADALESVLAQTFTDWECVVVNDGSTDRSAEIVARYVEQDPRIRLVHQPNQGVCAARNTGAAHASPDSEYLFFLDADDMLEPEALERLVAYLEAHPEVGLVGCQFTRIDAEGKPMNIRNPLKISLRERTRWAPGFLGIPHRLRPSEAYTPFLTCAIEGRANALPFFLRGLYALSHLFLWHGAGTFCAVSSLGVCADAGVGSKVQRLARRYGYVLPDEFDRGCALHFRSPVSLSGSLK